MQRDLAGELAGAGVRVCIALGLALSLAVCGGSGGGSTNHAPTAASATITTTADTPSAPVTPSITDPDAGDAHTFAIVTPPGRGSGAVVSGQLVYTPDPAFSGTDRFTFSATDRGGLSVTGTATVTVTRVNHAPSAVGGGRPVYTLAASASTRLPWIDDVDVGDTFTFQVTSQPAHGAVAMVGNRWAYTPDATTGSFTFGVQGTDGAGTSVTGNAVVRVYDGAALTSCTGDGAVAADGTLAQPPRKANACAFYSATQTRTTAAGTPVSMDYFVLRPSSGAAPKAVVVLIGGGNFDMGLTGTGATGIANATGGGNFVVRAAQMFADKGYVAVALDRPTDLPTPGATDENADADAYRVSVRHAVDVLAVLKHLNSEDQDVFVSGTSRGAISAMALNPIAAGVSLSSPVTTDTAPRLWVGKADVPSLTLSSMQRPVHVLWEQGDTCSLTPPAATLALEQGLVAAGATAAYDVVAQSLTVTTAGFGITPDPCGPYAPHGFLGKETQAVANTAAWLDQRVAALAGNHRPSAAYVTVPTPAGVARRVDLSTLASDRDGDPLSFALPYATTTLGGSVSLAGSMVSYTPPASVTSGQDAFVYVVTDGRGGVNAAVVTVQIGG
jgi:hypothetical protein